MRRRILSIVLATFMICSTGCQKTDGSGTTEPVKEAVVTESMSEEKEEVSSEEVIEEETTEEVVEDDYTKHGIWQHEVEANVYEYFVFLEDGTGYLIYLKNIYDITWSYSPSINQIHVGFVEMGTGANYTLDDSNSVVMLKGENYSFIFLGNDKDEEQKMIDEAMGASGNKEEKVDGATIIKKNGVTRKVYDTPLKMVDDEYITYEIISVFVDENCNEGGVYAGYEFNVINKTDTYAWVTVYDYYVDNTQVDISYSDWEHSFSNPLRGGSKSLDNNKYGVFNSMTIEDMETLSFSVQLNITDAPDGYGTSDQVYIKSFDFPKE